MKTNLMPMDEIRKFATCPFGTRIEGFERCGAPATVRYADALYCEMHQRLIHMRRMAFRDEKAVPTFRQLAMLIPPDMRCPKCGVVMVWKAAKGQRRSNVLSLNHMNDGAFSLDCLACNNTHAHSHSVVDEYDLPPRKERAGSPPQQTKTCIVCLEPRPLTDFWKESRKRLWDGPICKTCVRKTAVKRAMAGGRR